MKYLFILILIFFNLNNNCPLLSQVEKDAIIKNSSTDYQEFKLILKKGRETKLNMIFYPEFNYKIILDAENSGSVIELNITDSKNLKLYSNKDYKYVNEWNYHFQSIINASLILNLIKSNKNEESVKVHIKFRYVGQKLE